MSEMHEWERLPPMPPLPVDYDDVPTEPVSRDLWLRRAAKRASGHLASIPPDMRGPAAKLLMQAPITPIRSNECDLCLPGKHPEPLCPNRSPVTPIR